MNGGTAPKRKLPRTRGQASVAPAPSVAKRATGGSSDSHKRAQKRYRERQKVRNLSFVDAEALQAVSWAWLSIWSTGRPCTLMPQHVFADTWVTVRVMATFGGWVLLDVARAQELHINACMVHPQAKVVPLQSRLETAEMQLADVTAALERLQSEHKRLQVGTCLPACAAAGSSRLLPRLLQAMRGAVASSRLDCFARASVICSSSSAALS